MIADAAPASLATLPNEFPRAGRYPWAVITSRVLAEGLRLDRGLLGTWRLRGIGPPELPSNWFKGRANCYRISAVDSWLAARHGDFRSEAETWATYLSGSLGSEIDEEGARWWARGFADYSGARAFFVDGVTFTASGWQEYLKSLHPKVAT